MVIHVPVGIYQFFTRSHSMRSLWTLPLEGHSEWGQPLMRRSESVLQILLYDEQFVGD